MVNKFVVMISGQKGDPSSTSGPEALWFFCWGSTLMEGQVVHPRTSTGCQQTDLHAGVEISSILLSGSAETPRARRRWVAEALKDLISFSLFLSGCFL
jgi:hypothetical protein